MLRNIGWKSPHELPGLMTAGPPPSCPAKTCWPGSFCLHRTGRKTFSQFICSRPLETLSTDSWVTCQPTLKRKCPYSKLSAACPWRGVRLLVGLITEPEDEGECGKACPKVLNCAKFYLKKLPFLTFHVEKEKADTQKCKKYPSQLLKPGSLTWPALLATKPLSLWVGGKSLGGCGKWDLEGRSSHHPLNTCGNKGVWRLPSL